MACAGISEGGDVTRGGEGGLSLRAAQRAAWLAPARNHRDTIATSQRSAYEHCTLVHMWPTDHLTILIVAKRLDLKVAFQTQCVIYKENGQPLISSGCITLMFSTKADPLGCSSEIDIYVHKGHKCWYWSFPFMPASYNIAVGRACSSNNVVGSVRPPSLGIPCRALDT